MGITDTPSGVSEFETITKDEDFWVQRLLRRVYKNDPSVPPIMPGAGQRMEEFVPLCTRSEAMASRFIQYYKYGMTSCALAKEEGTSRQAISERVGQMTKILCMPPIKEHVFRHVILNEEMSEKGQGAPVIEWLLSHEGIFTDGGVAHKKAAIHLVAVYNICTVGEMNEKMLKDKRFRRLMSNHLSAEGIRLAATEAPQYQDSISVFLLAKGPALFQGSGISGFSLYKLYYKYCVDNRLLDEKKSVFYDMAREAISELIPDVVFKPSSRHRYFWTQKALEDPVAAFLEDNKSVLYRVGGIPGSVLFLLFTDWCVGKKCDQVGRTTFYHRAADIIQDKYPDIERKQNLACSYFWEAASSANSATA